MDGDVRERRLVQRLVAIPVHREYGGVASEPVAAVHAVSISSVLAANGATLT